MSKQQLAAFTAEQLAALPTSAADTIAMKIMSAMSSSQLDNFTEEQLAKLSKPMRESLMVRSRRRPCAPPLWPISGGAMDELETDALQGIA